MDKIFNESDILRLILLQNIIEENKKFLQKVL